MTKNEIVNLLNAKIIDIGRARLIEERLVFLLECQEDLIELQKRNQYSSRIPLSTMSDISRIEQDLYIFRNTLDISKISVESLTEILCNIFPKYEAIIKSYTLTVDAECANNLRKYNFDYARYDDLDILSTMNIQASDLSSDTIKAMWDRFLDNDLSISVIIIHPSLQEAFSFAIKEYNSMYPSIDQINHNYVGDIGGIVENRSIALKYNLATAGMISKQANSFVLTYEWCKPNEILFGSHDYDPFVICCNTGGLKAIPKAKAKIVIEGDISDIPRYYDPIHIKRQELKKFKANIRDELNTIEYQFSSNFNDKIFQSKEYQQAKGSINSAIEKLKI